MIDNHALPWYKLCHSDSDYRGDQNNVPVGYSNDEKLIWF